MRIGLVSSALLYKSLKSILIIFIILIFRKRLNLKSIKGANTILWTLLLIYLIFPKDILFSLETYEGSKFIKIIFAPSILINQAVINITYKFPSLSWINRIVGSILVIIYTVYQFIKFKRVISNSIELKDRTHLNESLKKFNIKREVKVYINDEIDTPITYGIFRPKIILQKSILKDWDSGTCYSNVRGLYVYKEIDGNRIQFTADVALVDPKCGNGSRILRGYDITLNRKRGGYFTTTSSTQYTANYSGYSVSLYVSDGRMWTD